MQEHQVSIGGTTYPLSDLYMVLATQNPIEHEGTYRLPEAQVDRFMLKVVIGYPNADEERRIMDRQTIEEPVRVRKIATPAAILAARQAVRQVQLDDGLKDYIVRLVFATRDPAAFGLTDLRPLIAYGVSPRATIYLSIASRANAFLESRDHVLPDDIKAIAIDVMRHRLIPTYQAEAEEITPEAIVQRVLDKVPLP
jgi:MoxR-like ATPase